MKKHSRELLSDTVMLFFFGAAFGIFVFIITYGTAILNIGNDTWILNSPDIDIKQHYIGFLHYLNAPWSFPLGCMDSLSYPYKMSVVWTDSIPGVCILVKLLKWAFPATPQLFGWFGLVTFALNGGTAALLLFRVTKNRTLSLFSSLFFILSFSVIQRMYYHTSLSAHFIILSAFLWFFYDEKRSFGKRMAGYVLFSFLCVSIHSYFLPIVGIILIFDTLKEYIRDKRTVKDPVYLFLPLFLFGAGALFFLYVYGAFSMSVNHEGFAVGGFNSNLNTFWNSLGDGLIPGLKNKYGTQYEGFGYLGLGMLVLSFTALVILIKKFVDKFSKKELRIYFRIHYMIFLTACMFVVFVVMAVIPEADLNEYTLIPDIFPIRIKRLLGVFRSNGRFIWGAVYITMLSSVYILQKTFGKKLLCAVVVLALILQTADISPNLMKKRDFYMGEYEYSDLIKKIGFKKDDYDHIIMTFENNEIQMNFGYYAAIDKKTLNRFYFARDINDAINEELEAYRTEAVSGHPDKRSVYIFNADTLKEWKEAPLNIVEISDDLFLGY